MKLVFKIFIIIIFSSHSLFPENFDILWQYKLGDSAFGNAALADIDNDGKPEIVFSTYRNDSTVYALNAENGSLLWKYNTGGCNDAAPIIYDVDSDNQLDVVVASSCVPFTFCFNGNDGTLKWKTKLHGSDSPPSIADLDGDGKPEILHGNFNGFVTCLNAEDGSIEWDFPADYDAWIQTAPAIFDANNNGQLDFLIANWSFDGDHRIFCYRALSHNLLWDSSLPKNYMYHGAAVADLDGDTKPEVVIGSYDGILRVFNAENGTLSWDYALPDTAYIAAPVSIGDINNDNQYEIVFFSYYHVVALTNTGQLLWQYDTPDKSSSFRGAALADVNDDKIPDVIFGTDSGILFALNGKNGDEIFQINLAQYLGKSNFSIDHAPVIGDFNKNGYTDIFIAGGHSDYPDISKNYGYAFAISTPVVYHSGWPMFRYNVRRTAAIPIEHPSYVNSERLDKQYNIRISPNPVTGSSFVISYNLNKNSKVKIRIIDITGRIIQTQDNIPQHLGENKIRINTGKYNANGLYFLQIMIDEEIFTKKIIFSTN